MTANNTAGHTAWQAIVAGVGGQGVLFVTRLLARALLAQGHNIMISEVHGMAQRGGSVISHLKAGHFTGPLVGFGQADMVFSLDADEAVRSLPFLAPKGVLAVNAPDASFLHDQDLKALQERQVRIWTTDASAHSRILKLPKSANMLMLAQAMRENLMPVDPAGLAALLRLHLPPDRSQETERLFNPTAS